MSELTENLLIKKATFLPPLGAIRSWPLDDTAEDDHIVESLYLMKNFGGFIYEWFINLLLTYK